jgi:hypothetical protein
MGALVPGFSHDVFVSYTHVDNRTFGQSAGWMQRFVTNLREALPQKLKRGEPNIWYDVRLSHSEPFSSGIRDAISQTATLLVMFSQSYLASPWCQRELELFLEAAEQTSGATGRIFLIRLDDTDSHLGPKALHELLGYKFFLEQIAPNASVHTLGTPMAEDPGERLYFQRLDDLSVELAKRLLHMCDAAMAPETANPASIMPEELDRSTSPAIFLAEATPDLDDLRDNIRRHLRQMNIRVLPETYYDRAPDAFRTALQADLNQSLLFVQLLASYVTPKTMDLPKGYEGLQLDVAEEMDVPILRWHAPELDTASLRDQDLLQRAEVKVMPFEDFKRDILNAISKRQLEQTSSKVTGDGIWVLVNANSCDHEAVQAILDTLDQQGVGYDTADEHEDVKLLVEQYGFQGLIVIYGQCEQQWAKQQVRLCRQLLMEKRQRAPVCAICVGPPDDKPALGIKLPNSPPLSYRDVSAIANFILAVQAKVAGP